MPLPTITIAFRSEGIEAVRRSQKGTAAMILRDSAATGGHVLAGTTDIPEALSQQNRLQIHRAFLGYINPPRSVRVCVLDPGQEIGEALKYYQLHPFDYLAGPPDISPEEAAEIAAWVKTERANHHHLVKAVLPNLAADSEAIVNFTASGIEVTGGPLSAADYCGRIAGLIAGTPMTIACTFATLPEVIDVDRRPRSELDAAIDRGEFVLFHDGEKVKVGRGVTSLASTTQERGEAFRKIKIVETLDMIETDIRRTAQDSYIGKYTNSYDNKCLLVMAIKGYLEELEAGGILEAGYSTVSINLEKQAAYLKKKGDDTSDMTTQQLKEANTGSHVFVAASIRPLDAIEDIDIDITI